jgi:hypothetical protein
MTNVDLEELWNNRLAALVRFGSDELDRFKQSWSKNGALREVLRNEAVTDKVLRLSASSESLQDVPSVTLPRLLGISVPVPRNKSFLEIVQNAASLYRDALEVSSEGAELRYLDTLQNGKQVVKYINKQLDRHVDAFFSSAFKTAYAMATLDYFCMGFFSGVFHAGGLVIRVGRKQMEVEWKDNFSEYNVQNVDRSNMHKGDSTRELASVLGEIERRGSNVFDDNKWVAMTVHTLNRTKLRAAAAPHLPAFRHVIEYDSIEVGNILTTVYSDIEKQTHHNKRGVTRSEIKRQDKATPNNPAIMQVECGKDALTEEAEKDAFVRSCADRVLSCSPHIGMLLVTEADRIDALEMLSHRQEMKAALELGAPMSNNVIFVAAMYANSVDDSLACGIILGTGWCASGLDDNIMDSAAYMRLGSSLKRILSRGIPTMLQHNVIRISTAETALGCFCYTKVQNSRLASDGKVLRDAIITTTSAYHKSTCIQHMFKLGGKSLAPHIFSECLERLTAKSYVPNKMEYMPPKRLMNSSTNSGIESRSVGSTKGTIDFGRNLDEYKGGRKLCCIVTLG